MVEGKHNKPEEIKHAKKAISEASDYSDIGTKERVPQFGEMAWEITKSVHKAFIDENKYVTNYRVCFTKMFVIIIWLIVLSIIAISFLAIFYNDNISLLPVLSSLSSLVATVVTVLIVQFRYIYNRKDNKLLDIIRDVLKLSSEHEKETKTKSGK